MRNLHFLELALAVSVLGCGDTGNNSDGSGSGSNSDSDSDGTDSETSTTDDTAGTDSGGGACPGISPDAMAAEGDMCTSNDDCMSGVCLMFRDVPPPTDAVCGPLPSACETRMTGTVLDFETGAAVPAVEVKVAKALEAATNPTGVTPVFTATSDDMGRVDATSPEAVSASIGLVALVGGGDFFLTATGLASPEDGNLYAPGVGIHDLWAVPTTTLTTWSDALATDAALDGFLPLGELGGVIGFIRDETTGQGVAGATVVPTKPDSSAALVRYLGADGTFNADASGDSGIFVLVAPGLAETFVVEKDGMEIQTAEGTAGSAAGAIFTLVMDVAP